MLCSSAGTADESVGRQADELVDSGARGTRVDAGGPIVRGREDAPSVGTEGDTVDGVPVHALDREEPAGAHVPDARRLVDAPREDTAPIRAEDAAADPARVAAERRQSSARGDVPNPCRGVGAVRQDAGAVRAERRAR